MDNSCTVSTPLDPKCSLQSAPEEEEAFEQNLYQQMIGSLMYLVTCTHPDLAHVVSFLSTFSARPLSCHHIAVKRVFKYIWTTRSLSLKYPKPSRPTALVLDGYSDASYANCLNTRRSYSGYAFSIGQCLISWVSKKQQSVATSTTEAEYMALSLTARQAVWYQHAFHEMNLKSPLSFIATTNLQST